MTKKTTIKAHDDPVRYCITKMIERSTAREIGTGKAALAEWDALQQACYEATGHSGDWHDAFEQWTGEQGERQALGDFYAAWTKSRAEWNAIKRHYPLIRELLTDTILDQLPSLNSKMSDKAMKELKRHIHALDDACMYEQDVIEIEEKTDGVYQQLMLALPMPKQGANHE